MSDWNPEHTPAFQPFREKPLSWTLVRDDLVELDRRAAAIRARDERIAELESAIADALHDLTAWGPAYTTDGKRTAIDRLRSVMKQEAA